MADGSQMDGFGFAIERRQPPHNLEAEQALLGALLYKNDVLAQACDGLEPDMFFEPVHGRIYEAICKLVAKDVVADAVKLKPYFEHDEDLKDVDGTRYLVKLQASATWYNAKDYANTIRDMALRRSIMQMAEYISGQAEHAPIDVKASEILEELEASAHELRGHEPQKGRLVRSTAEVVGSALERFRSAADKGGIVGLPTGFKELDKIYSLAPSEVTVLAGRPAMGKSALGNHITFAASHGCDISEPVGGVFFSKEMDGEDNIARAISAQISRAHSRTIAYFRIRQGKLSADEWLLVEEAAEVVSRSNIIWVDEARLTPDRIYSIVKRAKRDFERQGLPLGLVTLDYLQQVTLPGKYSLYEQTTKASAAMLDLAKEFHIPVLVLSQLSRNVEMRDNKRPVLSDLRDSGSIEQDAANIIFPFREEYYLQKESENNQEAQMKLAAVAGITELILAKNRNGPCQTVKVQSNMAANHYQDMPNG